ncbi:MAG: hypothetical protein QOI69_476, partial [Pseudonocardiales bacterium]|nr:hypothetical protein [Pseudonocardiales bacterium]
MAAVGRIGRALRRVSGTKATPAAKKAAPAKKA